MVFRVELVCFDPNDYMKALNIDWGGNMVNKTTIFINLGKFIVKITLSHHLVAVK